MNELTEILSIHLLLGLGCVALGIAITCGYICWRIVYNIFCFVDDKKAETTDSDDWLAATFGAWFSCAALFLALEIVRGVWLFFIVPVFGYLPFVAYIWAVSIAASIYMMRYLRRTHKAIHGHVTNPEAHTEKEKDSDYLKQLDSENKFWEQR